MKNSVAKEQNTYSAICKWPGKSDTSHQSQHQFSPTLFTQQCRILG